MSTSAMTRSARKVPLGAGARRSLERRVREAQAQLLRDGRRTTREPREIERPSPDRGRQPPLDSAARAALPRRP